MKLRLFSQQGWSSDSDILGARLSGAAQPPCDPATQAVGPGSPRDCKEGAVILNVCGSCSV